LIENEACGLQELTVRIQATTYTLAADDNFDVVIVYMSEINDCFS
jgi:hypothetical protein